MKTFFIFISFVAVLQSQTVDFKKDSLQFKVYTTIDYKAYTPKKIKILKIFCDYCNEAQLQFLKRQAWDQSYKLRKSKEYLIENGTSKLAVYFRVPKTYFRSLNNEKQR